MNKLLQRFEADLTKKYSIRESIPILIAFISLFILLTIAEACFRSSGINGIISQLQVLTSILLTIHLPELGFYAALILNFLLSLLVLIFFFTNHALSYLPGIIVPLFTMLTISILRFFIVAMINKIHSLRETNTQLLQVNLELDRAHKDLEQQHQVLESYNHIIRENEDRLLHLAYYDLLTDLPNRRLLSDRMTQLISFSREHQTSFYLVFIDLDQFRRINDQIGISGGDYCLKVLARRLQTLIDPDDLLVRPGSDKFILLIKRMLSVEALKNYLHQLSLCILAPIDYDDQTICVYPSFGIATYPHDGTTVSELLALTHSDRYKKAPDSDNNITFFSPL